MILEFGYGDTDLLIIKIHKKINIYQITENPSIFLLHS